MAADTAAKRYSAMNMSSPWRGLCVVPNASIPVGERQAVMFWYSGISFGAAVPVEPPPTFPEYPIQPPKVNYNTRGRIQRHQGPYQSGPDAPYRATRGRY